MWYNDILIILMGFLAVLMILMALLVSSRARKPKPVETEEEKPEKVYIEKGFEKQEEPEEEQKVEVTSTYIDPEPVEEEDPIEEEKPPQQEEEETEIDDIPEIELPPLEPDDPETIPEEIEPEPEPEPEAEPVVPVVEGNTKSRRLRKPVIDESDPDLKVDLGVETCPNCGAKVPDTIYCILCGKPLDPENTIGYEEEEKN